VKRTNALHGKQIGAFHAPYGDRILLGELLQLADQVERLFGREGVRIDLA